VRKFAIVPAVALVLSVTAFAQDPIPQLPPPQDPESRAEAPAPAPQTKFRSGTSMVALNVTVTDGRKLVTGLTQDHFEVYEDGVRQQVRFFEARSVPMDVILLLDTSSSMREKMPIVHEAARGFMRLLRQNDRGAVVAFNEKVTVLQELTSDTAAIERAIGSAEAKGSTALHNALYVALKQFGRPASGDGEIRRQAIAVLSDGEDTSSVVAFDDVVALARKTGVSIYPIALQSQFAALRAASDRRYFSESDHAMRTLAKETGAQAFFPTTVHDLRGVYASIAEELEAQYSIAYSPSNSRADGRFRRIIVRVTADPTYRPRARAGYTAEGYRAAVDGAGPQLR